MRVTLPSKPFILARNWDRFGGRLSEILNGYYLSNRFELEFRFVWPDDERFPEMKELITVFSEAFLNKHLIQPDQLHQVEILQIEINEHKSAGDFLSLFHKDSNRTAYTISDFFKVPVFKDDTESEVLRTFKSYSEDIWSNEVNNLRGQVSKVFGEQYVLHARYGDLVTGDWSNFVDPKKYLTWNQIRTFLVQSEEEGKQVILISDTNEISAAFTRLLSPSQTLEFSGFEFEKQNLETLIDLFKMECSSGVYSPLASAYSTLGAHLSGRRVCPLPVTRNSDKNSIEQAERKGSIWEGAPNHIRSKLVSRDVDQEINRLDGVFDSKVFIKFSSIARQADPKNVSSINHLAIAAALNGKTRDSRRLLLEAKSLSLARMHIHQDPLFMSLTTEFICVYLELLQTKNPFTRYFRVKNNVRRLEKLFTELQQTQPYQIDKNLVEQSAGALLTLIAHSRLVRGLFSWFFMSNKLLNLITRNPFPFVDNQLFIANMLVSLRIHLKELTWNRKTVL